MEMMSSVSPPFCVLTHKYLILRIQQQLMHSPPQQDEDAPSKCYLSDWNAHII